MLQSIYVRKLAQSWPLHISLVQARKNKHVVHCEGFDATDQRAVMQNAENVRGEQERLSE